MDSHALQLAALGLVSASWHYIVSKGDPIEALNLLCLVSAVMITLWSSDRLPFVYSLYLGSNLAFLLTAEMGRTPLKSVSLLTLTLFPCFFVLAGWLARRPLLAATWLVVSIALEAMLFDYWVNFGFVA